MRLWRTACSVPTATTSHDRDFDRARIVVLNPPHNIVAMVETPPVGVAARERDLLIGSEDLDGHPTTVFQVIARERQEDVIYYQWWAEDLQLPLRLARKDGAWIVEFRTVKLRSLSTRLFEVPLNYQPIESAQSPG